MMKSLLLIVFCLLSGMMRSQPGCDYPHKGNYLVITYSKNSPLTHSLYNGQYLKCDTLFTDAFPALLNIPLNQDDTIKLNIVSDKVKVNLFLTTGNLLRIDQPAYYFIYGIPERSGTYIVNVTTKKRDDFDNLCGFDITPEMWVSISSDYDSTLTNSGKRTKDKGEKITKPGTYKDTTIKHTQKIKPEGDVLKKEKSDSIVSCDCIEIRNEMYVLKKDPSQAFSGKCQSGAIVKEFSRGRLRKTVDDSPVFTKGRVETEYYRSKQVEAMYYENGKIRQKTIKRSKTIFRKRKCTQYLWDETGKKSKNHCKLRYI